MSTSSFSGGKTHLTGTQPSGTQPSSQQARGSQVNPSQVRGSQVSSSQQGSSGTKNKPILFVTAADSLAGASLVNHLADLGVQRFQKIILAVDTDSNINDKVDAAKLTNVEIKRLNFKSPDANMLKESLTGVDMIALIPPKDDSKFVASRALLKAADECKIMSAVFLSWTGTNAIDTAEGTFTQLKEVKKLEDEFTTKYKGISSKTVVRANFYAQNLITYAKQIVEQGHLPIPTGKGKFAPLDAEVLGKAMAAMLTDADIERHAGQIYTLTGPEALDAEGIAQNLSKAMGSKVEVKQITMDEARELLSKAKPSLAKSEIETIIETYTLVKQDRMDQISSDLLRELDIQHPSLVETIKRDVPMFKKVSSQ